MAFLNQKESILKFYEETNKTIDQNKETYAKLVSKLNEKAGLTQTLTNNLDDFMEYSFPDFNKFRNDIQSQPLEDSAIQFVFDINKNEYVSNFTLPNKKIVVKQNFRCLLMEDVQSDYIERNFGGQIRKHNSSFKFRTHIRRNDLNKHPEIIIESGIDCSGLTNLVKSNTFIGGLFNRPTSYIYLKEQHDFEIWIDDYFNIYVPHLSTYLVYNYSKLPLYAFYNNMDKLNLYHNHIENSIRTLVFNQGCSEDLEDFNIVKSVYNGGNYYVSEDRRNEFKTLFPQLLKFYQYSDKQKYFSQFQNLAEKLEQLAPVATVNLTDKDTMNDEKKIFSQSQRIRELEVKNHKYLEEIECLRSERTQFIEKDINLNDKLSDYQKLLEELNAQLLEEIDKTVHHKKEVLKLKTVNLETNEVKNLYRRQQDINTRLESKLKDTQDKLSEQQTVNSTLIDKQMEAQQKLKVERQSVSEHRANIGVLKLDIEKCNAKIKELECDIGIEKQQHILSKTKIDELINGMKKEQAEEVEDQYQEILLSQLKDKNDEIAKFQKLNTQLTENLEKKEEQFKKLKSKVSSLFNN